MPLQDRPTHNINNPIDLKNESSNLDYRYGPYESVQDALNHLPYFETNTGQPNTIRGIGRTVLIIDRTGQQKEYWFKGGIKDEHLVPKVDFQNNLDNKLDRGGYAGTAQDLKDLIDANNSGGSNTNVGDLKIAVDNINNILKSNDPNYDTFQEIVNAIKTLQNSHKGNVFLGQDSPLAGDINFDSSDIWDGKTWVVEHSGNVPNKPNINPSNGGIVRILTNGYKQGSINIIMISCFSASKNIFHVTIKNQE